MAYGKIKADTLVYDNSGSDVEVTLQSLTTKLGTSDIGNSVQAFDADTAKRDTTNTFTALQTLNAGLAVDGPYKQTAEALVAALAY